MASPLPPLNSLRAFECAARHLSFTKAADELNITQSAVSHQVRTLEDWLGFPLFERNGQRVSLSPGGAIYAGELGPVFTRILHATQDLLTSGSHQILNLRGYGTFFVRWLIPRISDFQEKNRDIKIRLTTHVEAVDFSRDKADMGIVYGDGPWDGNRSDLLFEDALIPVVSPHILAGQSWPCSLSQMLALPMLHSRRKVQWEDWLQAVGATRKPAENDMFFEDVTILYQCLLEGLGVALVQVKYVEDDLAQGRLVTPFPYTLRRPGGYHLVSPLEISNDDKIVRFREWLLAQIQSPSQA
jgi:LysR family glycine cleavage system transcriptional activator